MEIVLDGWLLKSPPAKRFAVCRAKWRKRWFVLRHSGQLPGQFFLEYYTDASCRKLKGRIDLDQCDRVDVGVEFEHRKINHHYIFDIQTPKRIYYLVTETEADMYKWVDCICSVCGLKINVDDECAPALETPVTPAVTNVPTVVPATNLVTTPSDSSPYIPISECISGKPVSNGFRRSSAETASLGRQRQRSSITEGRSSLRGSDFYDYPKPIYQSNHDRTSPEPNMDDMHKVPPLTRPLMRNDWENNFTDDDSCPLFPPPTVNWTTYPEDKVRKPDLFAYDVPVPVRQSFTASRELKDATQRLEKISLNDSKAEIPQDVENPNRSACPPPRPPKPSSIREKRKYENVDMTSATAHYDVPPTSKGVFLSKTLPAQVFSFLKDDDDLPSPSTKVPIGSKGFKLDDMYDFPRARNEESSLSLSVPLTGSMGRRQPRKHSYTNAPPGLFVTKDTVMNYEYRPGILPVDSALRDPSPTGGDSRDATDSVSGVSPSPLGTYANVPNSPTEREAPPAIDRNLKPKKLESGVAATAIVLSPPPLGHGKVTRSKKSFKKPSLSATGKINSIPPPIPQQSRMHSDISFSEDDERSSSTGSRRNSTNDDQLVPAPHFPKGRDEIQYLDLDLDSDGMVNSPKSPERHTNSTVYKTVDFIKTKVFNEMRQNVEESYRKSQ